MKKESKKKSIVGVSVCELLQMEKAINQLEASRVGGAGEQFLDEGMLSGRFCEFLSSEKKEVDWAVSFENVV